MKRFFCLVLAVALLSGCSFTSSISDPVRFYYPRAEADYNQESSLIAYELREATGHRNNLGYLISMYLLGPVNESLIFSFPADTSIFSIWTDSNSITLEISDTSRTLTDANFSLACACLTLTCLDIKTAKVVTIVSGERTFTSDGSDLLLADSYYPGESADSGGLQ